MEKILQRCHPLEHDQRERDYFERALTTSTHGPAAYRRATERLTGSLPSWMERSRVGRKPALMESRQ